MGKLKSKKTKELAVKILTNNSKVKELDDEGIFNLNTKDEELFDDRNLKFIHRNFLRVR